MRRSRTRVTSYSSRSQQPSAKVHEIRWTLFRALQPVFIDAMTMSSQSSLIGKFLFLIGLIVVSEALGARVAEAQAVTDQEKNILTAMVDTWETTLENASAIKSEVTVSVLNHASTKSTKLEGEAYWQDELFRMDYALRRLGAVNGDKEGNFAYSGTVVRNQLETIDFQRSEKRAFIAKADCRTSPYWFRIHPKELWFTFEYSIPFRTIITENDTFDYGDRNVQVNTTADQWTFELTSDDAPGRFSVIADPNKQSMPSMISLIAQNGIRYKCEYEWEEDSLGQYFPTRLRVFSRAHASQAEHPWMVVEYKQFVRDHTEPETFFSGGSLGIDKSIATTTYREGRPPVRYQPPVDAEESLREIAEQIKGKGFAAPKP